MSGLNNPSLLPFFLLGYAKNVKQSLVVTKLEWVKLQTSDLAGTFTEPIPSKSLLTILNKRERGHIQELPKILL